MSRMDRLNSSMAAGSSSWLRRICTNMVWGITTIVRNPRARATPVWRGLARLVPGAIVAIGMVMAAMVLADAAVAELMRPLPRWIIRIFRYLTDFGRSGWFLIPTGVVFLMVAMLASPTLPFGNRLTLAAIGLRGAFLFLAIAVPGTAVTIVKRLIGRARPHVGEHIDPFLYAPPIWHPDYASLPSGHATSAFAAAVAIALIWPKLRGLMLIYAFLVAASRVVLSEHYVSDVLAGAIVGTVGALLVRDWFAARRLGFVISASGRVDVLPGPSFTRIKTVARKLFAS